MAAKSVLKSSVSAVLAAVLGLSMGAGLLLPAAAQAQENRDRGERGSGRMERSMSAPAPARSVPPSMPPMSRSMDRPAQSAAQAPAWQGRAQASQWQGRGQGSGQAANPQQGWGGRPAWSPPLSQGGSQPDRGPRQVTQPGSGGRPSWQPGVRGDRANSGGSGFGQPGGVVVPPATVTNTNPSWGGRNPTYTDPRRNPANGQRDWNRGNNGNWNRDRDGNRGRDWNRDGNRDWNRDRNGNRDWANGGNRGGDRDWNRGGNWNRDRGGNRDWNRGHDWNRNGYASNQWRGNGWNGNRNWNNNGWGNRWDRNGWRRDNRYNWHGWRNSHRDIFRGGFYSAPFQGYSYSRLSIGLFLGNAFFDQQYWIADPYAYRLPPAYEPYQWVRYFDDVVLVDTYTGEVVDVIHNFFW